MSVTHSNANLTTAPSHYFARQHPQLAPFVVAVAFVAVSVSFTSAPGIAPPCWSVTWPVTVALDVAWDQAGAAPRINRIPITIANGPNQYGITRIARSLQLGSITLSPFSLSLGSKHSAGLGRPRTSTLD